MFPFKTIILMDSIVCAMLPFFLIFIFIFFWKLQSSWVWGILRGNNMSPVSGNSPQ